MFHNRAELVPQASFVSFSCAVAEPPVRLLPWGGGATPHPGSVQFSGGPMGRLRPDGLSIPTGCPGPGLGAQHIGRKRPFHNNSESPTLHSAILSVGLPAPQQARLLCFTTELNWCLKPVLCPSLCAVACPLVVPLAALFRPGEALSTEVWRG